MLSRFGSLVGDSRNLQIRGQPRRVRVLVRSDGPQPVAMIALPVQTLLGGPRKSHRGGVDPWDNLGGSIASRQEIA